MVQVTVLLDSTAKDRSTGDSCRLPFESEADLVLPYLVPCWGHIKNDHFESLLGFHSDQKCKTVSNKDPVLLPYASRQRSQMCSVAD